MKEILIREWVCAGVLLDDFQSDIAVQDFVKRAVDDAHSAFADFVSDAVMAEDLTDQKGAPRNVSMLRREMRGVNASREDQSKRDFIAQRTCDERKFSLHKPTDSSEWIEKAEALACSVRNGR